MKRYPYDDIENLKKKVDCGAAFFITQMFYDNAYYYRLLNEARRAGVNIPIIPGVMPLTGLKNIAKSSRCAAVPCQSSSEI